MALRQGNPGGLAVLVVLHVHHVTNLGVVAALQQLVHRHEKAVTRFTGALVLVDGIGNLDVHAGDSIAVVPLEAGFTDTNYGH